jgi:peptidoglycan/LPS O-acetylase OafA/YrhL
MTNRRLDSLEFLRAACALVVLFTHLYVETRGLPQHAPLVALASFSSEAVIGFFVLSGCVISRQHYRDSGRYLQARLVRLLPIYFLLLGFSVLAMWACGVTIGMDHLLATAFFADSLYSDTLFPLRFFIPSWSLAYELYYYVAFVAILAWPRLVLPLFAASIAVGLAMYVVTPSSEAASAVEHAFSFFCMWLAGVLVTGVARKRYAITVPTAAWLFMIGICLARVPLSEPSKFDFIRLLGFSAGFACLVWSLVSEPKDTAARTFDIGLLPRLVVSALVLAYLFRFSTSHLSMELAVSAGLAAFTAAPKAMCEALARLARPIMPFMVYVGGLSYALYLVHYPLIQTFNILSPLPAIVDVAIVAGLSLGLAHLLDYKFQPWVRARLMRPSGVQSSSVSR